MAIEIYNSLSRFLPARLLTIILLISITLTAGAFPTDFYASSSVLGSGKWVKIRVDQSGMFMIPTATLRSWGFNNPEKVSIHGYGGARIDDYMGADSYVDDLPRTPSAVTDAGVIFYAVGAEHWAPSGDTYRGELNPYSAFGYYFVTETDSVSPAMATSGSAGANTPATTAQGRHHHETERLQATPAGPLFIGEDFRNTRTQTFAIPTPGRVADTDINLEACFVHNVKGSPGFMRFTANNTPLAEQSADRIAPTSDSHYVHASASTTRHKFRASPGETLNIGLTYETSGSPTMAALDYLSVVYTRSLELPADGHFVFWTDQPRLSLGAPAGTEVWDVTRPDSIVKINTSATAAGRLEWTASLPGMRTYAAWRPGASFPAPVFDDNVANQNLHAAPADAAMIIITPGELMGPAARIAELHRSEDGMTVEIVDQEKIYNEYSSGTYDVSGIRKFLKHRYDMSAAAGTPLEYVLLMGRTTLDHRTIYKNALTTYRTTPWWVVRQPFQSMSDNDGFGTDDFIAMLKDGSGQNLGLDSLCVAVGRIPALTAADGDAVVDKLYQYVQRAKKTGWKNRMIVLADDEDQGEHLHQAESLVSYISQVDRQQHVIDKIYIDAYQKVGNVYNDARREMYRLLDDGVAWWIYTGHANNHSWTGEGMLTYTDINNMYLRNVPFVLASTCDFLRWDGHEISGGEIMYKERYGGSIGMISATRPVYISDNAMFLNAFGRQALTRDEEGILVRSGEAYRRTKNDIRNKNGNLVPNTNRLRFVFMGDPAMAVSTPSNIIEVTAINGIKPDQENQVTIGALGNATIEGRVTAPDGQLLSDFNGVVTVDIFDSDYSVTTLANGDGVVDVFDRHGDKLFSGSTTVENGVFKLRAPMPSQIADNFRNATMSLYAYATNSNAEAVGINRDFYVYGFDEPDTPDTTPPTITEMVLNHAGFTSGEMVNSSPMLIARVEDNVGVNLSLAGIGQQMTITLDDHTSFNDVAIFYTPSPDGSPSGTINYPLENLTEGSHTLKLRVFDTSGNTSAMTIDFYVSEKVSPRIFQLYTDANPASTSASFYVRHDRPDTYMSVDITVYNLMGQPLWTGSSKGMSDLDVSAPVTWNLCDAAGHRVQRGIYLYRASITTDNEHYETAAQRLAVTAQ